MKEFFKRCKIQIELFKHFSSNYISLIKGVWKISKLSKPVITIFGGSRMKQDDHYAQQARALGTLLVDNGMSVITGGGPGIMEAANCGAYASSVRPSGIRSIGIEVEGLAKEGINRCADQILMVEQFGIRKWLLIHYAGAFIVFPGGYGTLDELFEVTTLMETGFLDKAPIILFGKDYWQTVIAFENTALKMGLLFEKDRIPFFITDDINEAYEHIKKHVSNS
jgi:hypothetical protein